MVLNFTMKPTPNDLGEVRGGFVGEWSKKRMNCVFRHYHSKKRLKLLRNCQLDILEWFDYHKVIKFFK